MRPPGCLCGGMCAKCVMCKCIIRPLLTLLNAFSLIHKPLMIRMQPMGLLIA